MRTLHTAAAVQNGGMVLDYLPIASAVLANVGGIVTAVVTHFKPTETRTRLVVVTIAVLIGLGGTGATIIQQRQIIAKQETDTLNKQRLRQAFGGFIEAGDVYLRLLSNPAKPAPLDNINVWADLVELCLNKNLGPGYVQRFRDDTGSVHGEPVAISGERLNYWNGVYSRVARLQQFSAEVQP